MARTDTSRRTVLLAEDDAKTAASLRLYLEHAGHRVVVAEDGEAALQAAARERPDVVVLDWMLPRRDGLEVCRTLRSSSPVPILMLTARGLEEDKLRALYQGADDYVVKPFSPREVVARVHAALRRAGGERTLQAGRLVLDPEARTATVEGMPLALTGAELRVLEALMRAAGRVLARGTLVERALSTDEASERTVDVHVARLRRKLGDAAGVKIVTVYGAGYRLDVAP
ncbi:MAG TPA: response regulator transcription factor [Candidatus Polarisedimenticolaceae bacterium]|nr:response regulator transcription factor [Candidatus Polarisedimenticolaceae bacterium]